VVAGPVEATAAGNVLTQAMALGDIGSVDEMRAVIRASFDVETFEPQETDVWAERYAAYRALKETLEG
jgi:rhamnulokinase